MSSAAVEPLIDAPRAVAGGLVQPHGRTAARRLCAFLMSSPASCAVVGLLVAVWLAELVLIGARDHRAIGYLAFGALPNADIPGRGSPGELWRFISSGLVHDRTSPLHLAVNCAGLLTIGSVIERLYARVVMLSALVLGIVAGGAAWMTASALDLVAEPDYTVGCSAGVSALIGMMLVYGYRHRDTLGNLQSYSMKLTATLGVAVLLLMGLTVPNLNNVAHGAGFVCGVLLAAVLPAVPAAGGRRLGLRTRIGLAAVVGIALVCVVMAGANLALRLTA